MRSVSSDWEALNRNMSDSRAKLVKGDASELQDTKAQEIVPIINKLHVTRG